MGSGPGVGSPGPGIAPEGRRGPRPLGAMGGHALILQVFVREEAMIGPCGSLEHLHATMSCTIMPLLGHGKKRKERKRKTSLMIPPA